MRRLQKIIQQRPAKRPRLITTRNFSTNKKAPIPIPRQSTGTTSQPTEPAPNFSILSCNVAGLRAVLANPEKIANFKTCVEAINPNLLCLQETKLQDIHVEDIQLQLLTALAPEFECTTAFWSCSKKPAKLGYSGVACLLRMVPKEDGYIKHWAGFPEELSKELQADGTKDKDSIATLVASEGRILTVEYSSMFVINTYVPNSGQGLKRLNYRTSVWDQQLGKYIRDLERKKPVVLIGDMNVAHGILDAHNFYPRKGFPLELMKEETDEYVGLSQLRKQPGCTIAERNSFQENILGERNEFVDSFRSLYPTHQGRFSYYSMRAGNRAVNRGLRLDYCIVPKSMIDGCSNSSTVDLVDSFICDNIIEYPAFSDHCPIGASFNVV